MATSILRPSSNGRIGLRAGHAEGRGRIPDDVDVGNDRRAKGALAPLAQVTRDCGARARIGSPERVAPALEAGVAGLAAVVFDQSVAGATPSDELIARRQAFEPVAVRPEALSTIGQTSVATGHPKGAMQSHRAVILNGAMTAQRHLRTPRDTFVTALSRPHFYRNVVFNGAMMYGLKLVLFGLIGDTFKLEGAFSDSIAALNDVFGLLGYAIIGVFAASWLICVAIYRAKGYDSLDVTRTNVGACAR